MSKLPNRLLSREDVQTGIKRFHYFTVGQLREELSKHDIPDDTPIVAERVEDVYFEKHRWGVMPIEGEFSRQMRDWNNKLASGEVTPDEYPGLYEVENHPLLTPHSEEAIKEASDQFIPTHSIGYSEEHKLLLVHLHY